MRLALVAIIAYGAFAQTAGVWETRARYPIQATEVSGTAIDASVYSVCGLTAQGSTNRLFRYDPRTDSWTERASLPITGGADHCNVASAEGKLYVLGAIRVGSSFVDGSTWEYDPGLDRWERIGQMNAPRGASGVAAIGANIYVAGGLSATGSVADFEVFNVPRDDGRSCPGCRLRGITLPRRQ
jgi:N-acetylneuraminic acid mutarotase